MEPIFFVLKNWLKTSFNFIYCYWNQNQNGRKNLINKNQRWEPIYQKYKANENTSKHNPKKEKNKQSSKDLMQRGLIAMK
jgi:hypothetical protein